MKCRNAIENEPLGAVDWRHALHKSESVQLGVTYIWQAHAEIQEAQARGRF